MVDASVAYAPGLVIAALLWPRPAQAQAVIDGFTPTGFTPIGLSLQQAANDLPPEGPRTILQDNQVAEQQLRCIADTTGGSYRTADTAAELADELRALSQYGLEGRPVEGAPAPQQAPLLEPGTYSDTILADEARWYAVELEQGDVLTVDVTQPGITVGYGLVVVEITDPAFESVEREVSSLQRTASVIRLTGPQIGEDPDDVPGTYYLSVEGANLPEGETVAYDFTLTVQRVEAAPSPSPEQEQQAVVVGLAVALAVVLRRQRRAAA